MKTYGSISPQDYTIETFYGNGLFEWKLTSSSLGTYVSDIPELETAVTIMRGNSNRELFIADSRRTNVTPQSNENGVLEHVIYSSVKHLFYDNNFFISGTSSVTSSLTPLSDDIFIVSIAQDFYGERIHPGSFQISIEEISSIIQDDGIGNLYVLESDEIKYIGNIFYDNGIAVITHNKSVSQDDISGNGLKFISGSNLYVTYETEVKNTRHEIVVRLKPNDFNFSWFNPSVRQPLLVNGELSEQIKKLNIQEFNENEWTIQSLMQSGIIKPYVTTIGLYNDKYELIAVAKLSTPIQRTFETEQIFIVRFDV